MIEKSRREYLLARIAQNSTPTPSGCRQWQGTKTKSGYGIIHFAKVPGEGWNSGTTAHRATYQAHHNIILDESDLVCHTCDNPSCVEPKHLFLGSAKDGTQDMLRKEHHAKKKHRLHTRQRVFTDEQIRDIATHPGSLKEVAYKFNTSVSYVSKLRNRKAKTLILNDDLC